MGFDGKSLGEINPPRILTVYRKRWLVYCV